MFPAVAAHIMLSSGRYKISHRLKFTGSHISVKSLSGGPTSEVLSEQGVKQGPTVRGINWCQWLLHQVPAETNTNNFYLMNCIYVTLISTF
ncbi:MAG: hypothetical protein ACI9LE_000463 [Paraglaciecola sp.]|jgi:hypothetical protein